MTKLFCFKDYEFGWYFKIFGLFTALTNSPILYWKALFCPCSGETRVLNRDTTKLCLKIKQIGCWLYIPTLHIFKINTTLAQRVMQSNIQICVHSLIYVFIHSFWKSRFSRYNLLIVSYTLRYSFWFCLCIHFGDRLSKTYHINTHSHLSQHIHIHIYIQALFLVYNILLSCSNSTPIF